MCSERGRGSEIKVYQEPCESKLFMHHEIEFIYHCTWVFTWLRNRDRYLNSFTLVLFRNMELKILVQLT